MNKPITIDLDPPSNGHFLALGPLPKSCPDVLMGADGIRAYRVEDLGDHNSIFAVESFGHLVPRDGRVELVPLPDGEPVIGYNAHPAVLRRKDGTPGLDEILGELEFGGGTGKPTISHQNVAEGSRIMQRFQVDWDCGDYWLRVWVHIFARSPVVQCSALAIRKDRTTARDVPFKMGFGEEVVLAPSSEALGLAAVGSVLRGRLTLDRGAVLSFRFSLLCRSGASSGALGDDHPLAELTEEAIEASRHGQRWFMPTSWEGKWLGGDPVFGTAVGRHYGINALHEMGAELSMAYGPRPYASAPNPNQGGAQNSLGVTWWAPAFVPQSFLPQDVHLWCAQDWGLRPMHLLTPGTADPISLEHLPPGTDTVSRQVYGVDRIGDQFVPKKTTKGEIPCELGNGRRDYRGAQDEQHMADGPLLAAYAMTGDPALRWIIQSCQTIDLAQKRPRAGWSNASRGDGRTIVAMMLAAGLIGNREEVLLHCATRLANIGKSEPGRALDASSEVLPGRVHRDPRLSCDAPAYVPYEEAVLAWACYLIGDYESAAQFGMAVAASLHFDGTRWTLPYAITWREDGSALTMEERAPGSSFVHPSGWALDWGGCGLRALLLAADEIGLPDGWDEHLVNARAAIEQQEDEEPSTLDRAHSSGWRTAVPAAPVGEVVG